jgi:archaellum component FlaF (FlaF/FlaG flagellin family)
VSAVGFSTSVAFIILITAGITAGLGLDSILTAYSNSVESAGDEQSDRMEEQIYTDIVILNFSASANATYDFSTGAQVDKWAAKYKKEPSNPPSTGPFIDGEDNFGGGDYTDIQTSNDNRADTDIDNGKYATHHFLFTISEDPATIYNLSVLWEGYGKQHPSYVYIWNYDALDWELIGIGTSTSSDNIVSKDLTVNSADPSVYLEAGNLHLVATSYESSGKQKLYTDYVRVFVSTGGLWVKNIGETTLDPDYAVLFDNSAYIDSSKYSSNVDGGYWDPTEVLRIAYDASTSISHLFKVTTGNGISDSYYYAP